MSVVILYVLLFLLDLLMITVDREYGYLNSLLLLLDLNHRDLVLFEILRFIFCINVTLVLVFDIDQKYMLLTYLHFLKTLNGL